MGQGTCQRSFVRKQEALDQRTDAHTELHQWGGQWCDYQLCTRLLAFMRGKPVHALTIPQHKRMGTTEDHGCPRMMLRQRQGKFTSYHITVTLPTHA